MSASDQQLSDPAAQTKLRGLAEQAARAGGTVAKRSFGRMHAVRLKVDRSEVTNADEAAQQTIIALIHAHQPDHAFIAEEAGATATPVSDTPPVRSPGPLPANDRVCWIIDPIDGTRNYVRGIPYYACSVAAMLGGSPVVAAVYDPSHDVMYSASQAEGIFCNGRTLADHSVEGEREAKDRPPPFHSAWPAGDGKRMPVVAIPSKKHGRNHSMVHEWVDRLVVRNFGSTALHLAMVAAGQIEAALATNGRLWDIAAGWLLVTTSGGIMTTPQGGALFPIDVSRYAGEEMPALALACGVSPQLLGLSKG